MILFWPPPSARIWSRRAGPRLVYSRDPQSCDVYPWQADETRSFGPMVRTGNPRISAGDVDSDGAGVWRFGAALGRFLARPAPAGAVFNHAVADGRAARALGDAVLAQSQAP